MEAYDYWPGLTAAYYVKPVHRNFSVAIIEKTFYAEKLTHKLPQDILEDAAMPVVLHLYSSV